MRQFISLTSLFIMSAISVGCATKAPNPLTTTTQTTSIEKVWFPLGTDSPSTTNTVVPVSASHLNINGQQYYTAKDGRLVLSQKEQDELERSGVRFFNPHPINGIEMSGDELGALMQDEDALFAFIKNPTYKSPGQVSFVIKDGALRENFERLAEYHQIQNFRWELDYEFYVPETKVVTANNFNQLLGMLSRGFPIEAEIVDDGKLLRVYDISANANRMSFVVGVGSLKVNFERLSKEAGWDDVWGFDHDYHVPTTKVIRGSSYKDILNKMLTIQNYPIVAETDQSNSGEAK